MDGWWVIRECVTHFLFCFDFKPEMYFKLGAHKSQYVGKELHMYIHKSDCLLVVSNNCFLLCLIIIMA